MLVFAHQAGGKRAWPPWGNFELFNLAGVNTQLLGPWEAGWLLLLITRTSRKSGHEGWGLESLPVQKFRGKKESRQHVLHTTQTHLRVCVHTQTHITATRKPPSSQCREQVSLGYSRLQPVPTGEEGTRTPRGLSALLSSRYPHFRWERILSIIQFIFFSSIKDRKVTGCSLSCSR